MKIKLLNTYSVAAILMMAAAAGFIAIALLSHLGEFVTAAFVISGMVCAITGIFLITFSGGQPVDPRFVGILPVQGCINLFRIAFHLGIKGNAYFLPPRITGEARVMQYNPVSTYTGGPVPALGPFPETSEKGLVVVPSCDPLVKVLKTRHGLVMTDKKEQIIPILRETTGEIFELAPGFLYAGTGILSASCFSSTASWKDAGLLLRKRRIVVQGAPVRSAASAGY